MTSDGTTRASTTARLQWGLDSIHRSHRQGRLDVYLLFRTTEWYRGTRSVHYWAVTARHRVDQGWLARSRRRPEWERSDDCRTTSTFFFSSRRRHTRCGRDWSSDVCSSD